MPANPVQEKRDLFFVFAQPNPSHIRIRVAITGEVHISADNEAGMLVNVTLQPADPGAPDRVYNLLDYAPIDSWRVSPTLLRAVQNGWLYVDIDPPAEQEPVVGHPDFIPWPDNAGIGDIIYFDGEEWVVLPPGEDGSVLTSHGDDEIPTYEVPPPNDHNVVVGQTTTGLTNGDFVYPSANNTWSRGISNGTAIQADVSGVYLGVPGEIGLPGASVPAARFTTAGGSPAVGALVFLASSADDGGTGSGKLTATPPSTGHLTAIGVVYDNTNYAALKTCAIVFKPMATEIL